MINLALLKLFKIKEVLSPEEYEKFKCGVLKTKVQNENVEKENNTLEEQLEKLSEK